MKPFIILSALTIAACGGDSDPPSSISTQPIPYDPINYSKFTVVQPDNVAFNKFGVGNPPWVSGVIRGESGLVESQADGSNPTFKLWRAPSQILSVFSPLTGQTFTRDVDWRLTSDNRIEIINGGAIPQAPIDFHKTIDTTNDAASISYLKDGTSVRISNDYYEWQIAVDYVPSSPIGTPQPSHSLPRLKQMIANGQSVAFTFYGDSITVGANSSDTGRAPYQPGYATLFSTAFANEHNNISVYYRNKAVGGMGTGEAAAEINSRVNDSASDVVFIAFGMNDAYQCNQPSAYQANVKAMIDAIRAKNGGTEIVLIAPMPGNLEWMTCDMFNEYRTALYRLQEEYSGVKYVDVWSLYTTLIGAKSFYDVTGNGVNHPNDFGHKLYAQILFKAILE